MWLEFKELFYIYLFLINTTTKVISKLERTSYYQESYTVKNYLDEFHFILKASYTYLLWQPLITKTNDHTNSKSLS